jgi:hypothetical protein
MLALSPLLLLTLASSVLASPLSSLPLETRHSVGRLSPEQRKELASRIAVELFANQEPTKVDNEQLEKDVAAWLEDVREQSAVEKRLFGFGDSRDDNQGNYGPVKGNCPSDTQFVRVSEVRPTVPPLCLITFRTRIRREGEEKTKRACVIGLSWILLTSFVDSSSSPILLFSGSLHRRIRPRQQASQPRQVHLLPRVHQPHRFRPQPRPHRFLFYKLHPQRRPRLLRRWIPSHDLRWRRSHRYGRSSERGCRCGDGEDRRNR